MKRILILCVALLVSCQSSQLQEVSLETLELIDHQETTDKDTFNINKLQDGTYVIDQDDQEIHIDKLVKRIYKYTDGQSYYLFEQSYGSGMYYIWYTLYDPETMTILDRIYYNDNNGIRIKLEDGELYAYHEYSFGMSENPIGVFSIETLEIDGLENHVR